MSIYKSCDTCKFEKVISRKEPCKSCENVLTDEYWQPKPIDTEITEVPSDNASILVHGTALPVLTCSNCGAIFNEVKMEEPIDTELPVVPCATETDSINSPSHYMQGGIETIEIIRTMLTKEEFQGYCKGNILKYRERAPYKGNADQDYAKARKYKQFLEESEKSD